MRRSVDTGNPVRGLWQPVVTAGVLLTVLGSLGFGVRALLTRQAAIARKRIGKPLGEHSPNADRVWQRQQGGKPIRLLLLGDSLAAGLGADVRKQTLGGRLAKGLARQMGRPVRLRTAAVVGSESKELADQLNALPAGYRADVAVIVVGGNDVTHLIPPAEATHHLAQAIERLQEVGTAVVVGTCPDLGTLRPVPQPLRSLLSQMSRHMAVAQRRAAEAAGATAVSLRRELGPIFYADPDEMFSLDRFHPSNAGYRRTAQALLPSLVAALAQRADFRDRVRSRVA